ncbi:HlyD family secretion protein [Legionella jordanis]|uniref:Multidrug efflux system n=1 Tax=Legionella jordanis TaxID=456 RepID=A0A0W0VBK6_9GAMM|nr:efflux RND transporter periplasmic adaptor subunit [Legionella jordanis]KTD17475.1 multidrug efflux system [Legionella jordanis]RMX05185.1 HlyD family efflux transporter periplasmic adaptor subunit [Legionella jordanis]RMX17441.1 HlyD family efflux transporter periplasmic adaptor subunit [Legionella jordanis]VEH13444.1 multidrug efflux system [Legionella jordanis]HAT8714363.1 HlyD family efflux transporter periplasmic adaptor subunit [Legionella jordanis]
MKERRNYYIVAILILILLFFLFIFIIWRNEIYTNDAYVQGNQVYIKPLRSGFVTGIFSDDTFFVRKGQLLVSLDETDSLIALDRAKANLSQIVREVCQAFHDVFRLQADIEIRKAQLRKAKQNFQHRAGAIKAKGVSLEDYQNAADDLRASEAALKSTTNDFQKVLAFVQGSSIVNHPAVQKASQEVRDAWVQLYRSKIYAPVDGLIAQRTIQVGMSVNPTEPLMSIIPLDQIWVNANFKETQLRHMRIGQSVLIRSDLYGDAIYYQGKIVGLPGGAGNAFSLLPPENLTGNWIKIVQRLPVRVALNPEQLKKYPLRIGLSLEVWANFSDQSGPLIPTTNQGPVYQTDIYKKEELGDKELIKHIILANLDPSLNQYAYQALTIKNKEQEV